MDRQLGYLAGKSKRKRRKSGGGGVQTKIQRRERMRRRIDMHRVREDK